MPHTHLDAGWVDTMEANYVYNAEKIITSIVNTLYEDSSLKFNYADLSFLGIWWD